RLTGYNSQEVHTAFEYDAVWRRLFKRVGGEIFEWVWAGDVLFSEFCPQGHRIDYVHHPIKLCPMAVSIDGEWYYVVTDQRGDSTDVIRLRDGRIVWSAEPRGFDSTVTVDLLAGRFALRSPGQYYDVETSLVYNRARYYDPREGRFLTPDPLGPTTGA